MYKAVIKSKQMFHVAYLFGLFLVKWDFSGNEFSCSSFSLFPLHRCLSHTFSSVSIFSPPPSARPLQLAFLSFSPSHLFLLINILIHLNRAFPSLCVLALLFPSPLTPPTSGLCSFIPLLRWTVSLLLDLPPPNHVIDHPHPLSD